jgi:uncharacterized protein (DUF697 family)
MTDTSGTEPAERKDSPPAAASDAERDALADKAIKRFSLYGAIGGLIPVTVVDAVAVGGVQFQMIRRLAEIYGVPFSHERAKSAIASAIGAIAPLATASGLTSGLKAIPLFGTVLGVLTAPALSAGSTYLLGKVFIQHFASGGTLLDFDPAKYREYIRSQAGKSSTAAA